MNNKELDAKIKKHFSERKLEVSAGAFDQLNLETSEAKSKKFIWFRVAAAILLLVGGSYFFINTKDQQIEVTNTKDTTIELKASEKQIEVVRSEQKEKQVPIKEDEKPTTIELAVMPVLKQKTSVARKNTQIPRLRNETPNSTTIETVQINNTKAKELDIDNTQVAESFESNKIFAQTFNTDVDLKVNIKSSLSKNKLKIDAVALLQSVEQSIAVEKQEDVRFREKAFNKITEGISYVSHTLLTDSEI